jgi:hypothetical protein
MANILEHFNSWWNYHKPKASNTCKTEHPHGDLKSAVSQSGISAAGAYTLGHWVLSRQIYHKAKALSLQRSCLLTLSMLASIAYFLKWLKI